MEFKDRVRQLRKEHGLTQKELGEKTGLATVTIQQYELGNRKPNFTALLKLAEVFHLKDITELYDATTNVIDLHGNLVSYDKSPTAEAGLDQHLMKRLRKLTPEEQEKVDAFVQGLIASR